MKILNRCKLRYLAFLTEFKSTLEPKVATCYEREQTEIVAPVGRAVRSASDVSWTWTMPLLLYGRCVAYLAASFDFKSADFK